MSSSTISVDSEKFIDRWLDQHISRSGSFNHDAESADEDDLFDELVLPLIADRLIDGGKTYRSARKAPRKSAITWAPLPVREDKSLTLELEHKTSRKIMLSKMFSRFRKWYSKQAKIDRQRYMDAIRSPRGRCHFCKEGGVSHRHSRQILVV